LEKVTAVKIISIFDFNIYYGICFYVIAGSAGPADEQ